MYYSHQQPSRKDLNKKMEETLTDCLVRVKEDLRNLKRVRNYLDNNKDTEGCCSITWRTIEAFNSILGVCSSQETPETNALDILLDSFYYLARNNADSSVWNNFGFELGLICVKVLTAIDRSEVFEVLFCKLLTVINVICEQSTNVWKSSARQILNVLINKKFSLPGFETVLKLYISAVRNVDGFALHNFSKQNLHLLKTLSMLVARVGDFEIQSDIVELVFLHLSNNTASMSDFFATSERKLFESLQFTNFEKDCRTYLNALNQPRGGLERKVYSIGCHVLFLGGCFVEPPVGLDSVWVDANRETGRLSIRCADAVSEGNRVVYVLFSDILHVELSNEKTEGRCLTIHTKGLSELQFDVKNDDVCLMVDDGEGLHEFVNFLTSQIKKRNKTGRKVSKTVESLVIDREKIGEIQDNAVTSTGKRGIEHIHPDIFNLFENGVTTATKASSRTPPRSQEKNLGSQDLSPNSFVESLNQHIGRDSPGIPRTFEDSVETIEFLQRNNPGGSHKLFRSPHKEFERMKEEEARNFSFIFDEDKENKPTVGERKTPRTYERKREKPRVSDVPPSTRILRERKNVEAKLADTQSEEYFQQSASALRKKKTSDIPPSTRILRERKNFEAKLADTQSQEYFQQSANALRKKKPSLPKLKRSRGKAQKAGDGEKKAEKEGRKQSDRVSERGIVIEWKEKQRSIRENPDKENLMEKQKQARGRPSPEPEKPGKKPKAEHKPSLLDPNGYAFRKWCEPTTSERGSFWLRKLNAEQKQKSNANVFNFSDNSDSDSSKVKKKKRRVVHSKRSHRTKETSQMSLKEVKDILRKASPKGKETTSYRRKANPARNPQQSFLGAPESSDRGCCDGPPKNDDSPRQSLLRTTKPSDRGSCDGPPKNIRSRRSLPMAAESRERSCYNGPPKNDDTPRRSLPRAAEPQERPCCDGPPKNVSPRRSLPRTAEPRERPCCDGPPKNVSPRRSLPRTTKSPERGSCDGPPKNVRPRRSLPGPSELLERSCYDGSAKNDDSPRRILPRAAEPQERPCCDGPPKNVNPRRSLLRPAEFLKCGGCDGPPKNDVSPRWKSESDEESDVPDDDVPPFEKPDRFEDAPPMKTKLSESLLSTLQNRLLEKEKKDRQETDEIIQAVRKAACQMFNQLQREECEAVKSYLAAAEEAVGVVQSEVEGLRLRSQRMERAMLYFRDGCSVAGLCESLESQFSGVKSALGGLAQKRDVSVTIDRLSKRLSGLIKSGIDKSMERELASRRNRLLKCASFLQTECRRLG